MKLKDRCDIIGLRDAETPRPYHNDIRGIEMTDYKSNLTQARLKELLHYNPESGDFTRLNTVSQHLKGSVAGSTSDRGYRSIVVDGKVYLAHRLVFLYMEGEFPPDQVDHRNRVRSDNRWRNLRHSTHLENHRNRIDNNYFIGVRYIKNDKKWRAYSTYEGKKQIYLGQYVTHLAACYRRWSYDVMSHN